MAILMTLVTESIGAELSPLCWLEVELITHPVMIKCHHPWLPVISQQFLLENITALGYDDTRIMLIQWLYYIMHNSSNKRITKSLFFQ